MPAIDRLSDGHLDLFGRRPASAASRMLSVADVTAMPSRVHRSPGPIGRTVVWTLTPGIEGTLRRVRGTVKCTAFGMPWPNVRERLVSAL